MLLPRLIPSLLIDRNHNLIKTTRFADLHYLGDPLNAAYVYSCNEVDELLVLDIDASLLSRSISLAFVESLARFTRVPLTVGGGIRTLSEIHNLLACGAERVILGGALKNDLAFLSQAVERFGSSTVSVLVNVLRTSAGTAYGYFGRGGKTYSSPLVELACAVQAAGAGEIVVYDVERDGTREGFDLDLYSTLSGVLTIPLVALGGCGGEHHIEELLNTTSISGVAAGSLFVYAPGTHEVLLNYPHPKSAIRKRSVVQLGTR